MKVFISWSGDRSMRVAQLLEWWLKCVIQGINPWLSTKNIDRGSLWFNEINDQLASTATGIVCLTKENFNRPWILFESGALAKGLSSNRVCTLLIDLEPNDLENPLAQFNHTFPDKNGLLSLASTINQSLKEGRLSEDVLVKCFDAFYPQFEDQFAKIIESTTEARIEERQTPDILNEVLSSVREMEKRMRALELESKHTAAKIETSLATPGFRFGSGLESGSVKPVLMNLRDAIQFDTSGSGIGHIVLGGNPAPPNS